MMHKNTLPWPSVAICEATAGPDTPDLESIDIQLPPDWLADHGRQKKRSEQACNPVFNQACNSVLTKAEPQCEARQRTREHD
jgi:hypothetical protein